VWSGLWGTATSVVTYQVMRRISSGSGRARPIAVALISGAWVTGYRVQAFPVRAVSFAETACRPQQIWFDARLGSTSQKDEWWTGLGLTTVCPDQEDTLRHLLQLQTPIAGEAAAILHAKRPQSPLLEGQASPLGLKI